MADQGAGRPDAGLYAARQLEKTKPRKGQSPERGVVEVKGPGDDAWLTADSDQVSGYWQKYRLVLVTNTRDFVLLGEDAGGNSAKLETFSLAGSEDEFETLLQKPRAFARSKKSPPTKPGAVPHKSLPHSVPPSAAVTCMKPALKLNWSK